MPLVGLISIEKHHGPVYSPPRSDLSRLTCAVLSLGPRRERLVSLKVLIDLILGLQEFKAGVTRVVVNTSEGDIIFLATYSRNGRLIS
jgi:hypothetical protein